MSDTIVTRNPTVKLYKRCSWGKHESCPGKFEDWSICSCGCHAEVAPVIQEAAETVDTWIADHPEIAAANSESISEALATLRTAARLEAEKPWTFGLGASGGFRSVTLQTQKTVERNHKKGLDAWGFSPEEVEANKSRHAEAIAWNFSHNCTGTTTALEHCYVRGGYQMPGVRRVA